MEVDKAYVVATLARSDWTGAPVDTDKEQYKVTPDVIILPLATSERQHLPPSWKLAPDGMAQPQNDSFAVAIGKGGSPFDNAASPQYVILEFTSATTQKV